MNIIAENNLKAQEQTAETINMTPNFDNFIKIIFEEHDSEEIIPDGEYWFDESGNTMYADGDVGDMNHESYVIQRCALGIADKLGMDTYKFDINWPTDDDFIDFLRDEYKDDDSIIEKLDNYDYEEVILNIIGNTEENRGELKCALDHGGDAREYAIKQWGWARVHGNHIEVKILDKSTLNRVARGVWNALDQEGKIYDEETRLMADQSKYYISTYTGKRYTISLDDMDSPDSIAGLESEIIPTKTAATKQLRDMDIEAMPSYYKDKGVIGDSFSKYADTILESHDSLVYSWLSPTGELFPVSHNHGTWADSYLKSKGIDTKQIHASSSIIDYMFKHGWARITHYGDMVYYHKTGGRHPLEKLKELKNICRDNNLEKIVWDNETDYDRTLWYNDEYNQ
jgi:hypothetical protein